MPVVLRQAAARDVDDAIEHYEREAGASVAGSFIDALEQALAHVARHPASGSPRYATELDLPGLRCWPLESFPYLVFYVHRESGVDVWRLLHSHQDIPAWLAPPGAGEVRESPGQYSALHDAVW